MCIDRPVDGRPDDSPPVPPDPITLVRLRNLGSDDFAAWRDRRRLRSVSAASVQREWILLSHACTVAQREWKWLDEHPMQGVRRPAPPEARDRRISDDEIERILFALGYSTDEPPATQTARVGAALLFAIETAMRASATNLPVTDRTRRPRQAAGNCRQPPPCSSPNRIIVRSSMPKQLCFSRNRVDGVIIQIVVYINLLQ